MDFERNEKSFGAKLGVMGSRLQGRLEDRFSKRSHIELELALFSASLFLTVSLARIIERKTRPFKTGTYVFTDTDGGIIVSPQATNLTTTIGTPPIKIEYGKFPTSGRIIK